MRNFFLRCFTPLIVLSLPAATFGSDFVCKPIYRQEFKKIGKRQGLRTVAKVGVGIGAASVMFTSVYFKGKALRNLGERIGDPGMKGAGEVLRFVFAPAIGVTVGSIIGTQVFERLEELKAAYHLLETIDVQTNPVPAHDDFEQPFDLMTMNDPFLRLIKILDWESGQSAVWNSFLAMTTSLNEKDRTQAFQAFMIEHRNTDAFCRDGKAKTLRQLAKFIQNDL